VIERNRYERPLEPEVKERFVSYLSAEKLKAGISRCFHSLADTYKYFKQAQRVLKMDAAESGNPAFLNFDDCAIKLMIDSLHNENLREYCHPILAQLAEYDECNNTDYMKTLYTYLKHSQEIKVSSTELFIHYNTMRYRIEKMREQFGIDFGDGSLLFHIWMSFLILDYLKQH
jgi:DNA-binding PucR family transcriptional regulator